MAIQENNSFEFELKLVESTRKNNHVLTSVFDKVKSKTLRKELYNALDVYNQFLYNDVSESE